MSQILNLYEKAPDFPASDQLPDAVRHEINVGIFRFADCIGGAPSQAELEAHLGLDAAGLAAAARLAADGSDLATCKADPQVTAFLNMTPADLDVWVEANITGAGNKTAFKVLGKLALMGARGRRLRG